jgi:signal transduction histidine kinase
MQKKLALILTLLAFVGVILSTWILTAFDRYHFWEYVQQNKQLRNERIANVLAQAYERDQGWSEETGVDVGAYCAREGVHIRLLDNDLKMLWQVSPEAAASPSTSPPAAPDWPSVNSASDLIRIVSQDKVVGYAEVLAVDPAVYSVLDYHYWRAMTQGVVTAIVPVVLLALAISWYLSRRITQPLIHMTNLAQEMRQGRTDVRVKPEGNDELAQLAHSLNHLAEELQKQDKLRKNLTADVAHELRTPLTTLKSHLEAFMDGVWELKPERLQDAHEEVERLIGLVASLESLTQAESDSLALNWQTEDLVDVTRSAVQLMEAPFLHKGVSLHLQFTGSVPAKIDRDKWKQIMLNLLENALKHTDAGGSVTVKVERETTRLGIVTVSDTGRGIEADHLPYIFERFYRADPSRNRATGGAGIGLAIVKKLVEAHGGTIHAASQSGTGTEFAIRIPITDETVNLRDD